MAFQSSPSKAASALREGRSTTFLWAVRSRLSLKRACQIRPMTGERALYEPTRLDRAQVGPCVHLMEGSRDRAGYGTSFVVTGCL
jgi:hypothetical protein